MRDLWYEVIYWIEDHLQYVLSAIVVLIAVSIFVVVGISDANKELVDGVKKDTLEEVEAVKKLSEEVDEVFSKLDERNMSVHEEYPAYEFDLYLKKPFITEKEFKEVVETFVDIYKWKENNMLSALKINVYDRKEVHELGLTPRAEIYYFKKLKSEQLLTEEEGGERERGDLVMEDHFQDTLGEGVKPDYEDYVLRISGFRPLDNSKGITPLTDQEFSFYLKMDMYRTLLGGNKYGGAKLYLQWDLGKDVYKDGIVAIEREFDNFYKRHTDINGQVNYFDNDIILKQKLAIEKPQFLLFALTNQVVENALDAQRELIKYDSDLFKRVIEENIDRQVEDMVKEENEDDLDEDDLDMNTDTDDFEDDFNSEAEDDGYIEFEGSGVE